MTTTDYTIQLIASRKGKGKKDEVVAEIEVEGATAGPAETAAHYAKHARIFMRHIRFNRAIAIAR